MASELFDKMGPVSQSTQGQPQNPKEAALNLMRQYGFQISSEQENDPNALMQMVLQKMPMARTNLARIMGRR